MQQSTSTLPYIFSSFLTSRFKKGVTIVVDNLNTNNCFANLAQKPFVGLASHCFNLALRNIIQGEMVSVGAVKKLMQKHLSLFPAAKL